MASSFPTFILTHRDVYILDLSDDQESQAKIYNEKQTNVLVFQNQELVKLCPLG